jgi:hypothetical protein
MISSQVYSAAGPWMFRQLCAAPASHGGVPPCNMCGARPPASPLRPNPKPNPSRPPLHYSHLTTPTPLLQTTCLQGRAVLRTPRQASDLSLPVPAQPPRKRKRWREPALASSSASPSWRRSTTRPRRLSTRPRATPPTPRWRPHRRRRRT